MQILVTGGSGFVGSHLCERLIIEGHNVTALDLGTTGKLNNLESILHNPNFKLISGSILDEDLLQELIQQTDYIFHAAAAVGVFNIVNDTLASMITNINGTEKVLKFAHEYKKPVFITSSSEIYGKNTSNSLSENSDRILGSPLTLRWSYSESKAIVESLAYAYHVEKESDIRIVRFFNAVGPRQLGAYGMVLPRFVKAALTNEPITIFGGGIQTRCFTHIYDVIDAVILVAFSKSTNGKVFNIGNPVETSIRDLAERVVRITNSSSEIVYQPYQEAYGDGFEDMQRRVPNIDAIKKLLDWAPKRNLDEIITDISDEMKRSF